MIRAATRGWLFVGLGVFFSLAAFLLVGGQAFTNLAAIFQMVGGLVLLGTGVGYVLEIDPFVETILTTMLASAGFGAAFVGLVGVFVL